MAADQWFVVLTNPQRETFVDDLLAHLQPYLPRFKTTTGRIAPLFPGYLFVPRHRDWSETKNTFGVRNLLMSGDHPACVPDMVIRTWRSKERGGLVQLPPPPRFRPGERLTILRGSLAQRSVIYAGMSGKERERVLIEMLGQLVTIIVPTRDLAIEQRRPFKNRLRFQRETLIRSNQRVYA